MLSKRFAAFKPYGPAFRVLKVSTSAFDPDLPSYNGPNAGRWLYYGLAKSARPADEAKKKRARLMPGLHSLNLRDWLLVDPARVEEELALKRTALTGDARENFLQASDETTYAAQEELQELMTTHLTHAYPSYYRNEGKGAVSLRTAYMSDALTMNASDFETPLEFVSSLIQEDVVLMRRDEVSDAYRMVAASVCFSFGDIANRVREQRDMEAIHRNVHGFKKDLERPVARVMKTIKADAPIWRVNWSLSWSPDLLVTSSRYPVGDVESATSSKNDVSEVDLVTRLEENSVGETLFLKAEYQTLRRLPINSDYIVFTVRSFIDPMRSIEDQPKIASELASNIRSIAHIDFAKYKGLHNEALREYVLKYLDSIVEASNSRVSQSVSFGSFSCESGGVNVF
jgi:hypothetical protein